MSRKRVQLSDLDRKKICQLAVEHKSLSQDKLTALLQTQLNKPELARSTVTGVLKERTKWLGLSDEAAGSKVRHRSAQWENLERALMQWFGQLRSRNAVLTDKLLLEKAKRLATLLDIADFKGSDGWLSKFKKRHHIQLHQPHGESGAADMAGVSLAQTAVGKLILELNYKLEDVYNFDETGLYYRARPSRTLAVGQCPACSCG
jgi:hypothetical protein